ncbi:hypothetical protein [Thermococcus sp. JdF3]|nr:hypothetical protein [Thermococcus sp. JdF3]
MKRRILLGVLLIGGLLVGLVNAAGSNASTHCNSIPTQLLGVN